VFAFAPVVAGSWQQHELWDGTYIYDDLLDWHEWYTIKQRNERIIQEYYETLRGMKNGSD